MIPWWLAVIAFIAGGMFGIWLIAVVSYTHNGDE